MDLFLRKNSVTMLELTFSSKLDWGSYVISIAKSFFLLRSLCISINLPHGHAWNTVAVLGLVLLVATWNCWISYKNENAELLVHRLLTHCRNVASLSLFYSRCSSELVPLPYSRVRSTCFSDRLYDFSVTIPICYKDVSAVSFLAQLDSKIFCL